MAATTTQPPPGQAQAQRANLGVKMCFVIDGSGPMNAVYPDLFAAYIKPLLESFVLAVRKNGRMACHYGLVIYGDLRPFSAVPVDRHLFTSDQGRFVRTLERLTFSGGNPLRNCVTEGLSAAVDWLCNVSGPGEVASTVLRHCVLVALAPPQLDTIGANGEPVYAAADLDALAQDMGTTKKVMLSLISPHHVYELDWMVNTVARAQRAELVKPPTVKSAHIVILNGLTIQSTRDAVANTAAGAPTAASNAVGTGGLSTSATPAPALATTARATSAAPTSLMGREASTGVDPTPDAKRSRLDTPATVASGLLPPLGYDPGLYAQARVNTAPPALGAPLPSNGTEIPRPSLPNTLWSNLGRSAGAAPSSTPVPRPGNGQAQQRASTVALPTGPGPSTDEFQFMTVHVKVPTFVDCDCQTVLSLIPTDKGKKLDIKVPAVLTQLIPQEHVLSLGGLPNSATVYVFPASAEQSKQHYERLKSTLEGQVLRCLRGRSQPYDVYLYLTEDAQTRTRTMMAVFTSTVATF